MSVLLPLWRSPTGKVHEAYPLFMETRCGHRIGALSTGWRPLDRTLPREALDMCGACSQVGKRRIR